MACNCSKCNNNQPCGCSDSALTNPCSYTDCSVGNERCDSVCDAACVSYTGTGFQIGDANQLLSIDSGERLDSIIQKFASMIVNGVGSCNSDDVNHNPYNVYATAITSTGVTVVWNGISNLSTGHNVYFDNATTPTGWQLVNTSPVAVSVFTQVVTALTPNTTYKIKVETVGAPGSCKPIEIVFTTLSS